MDNINELYARWYNIRANHGWIFDDRIAFLNTNSRYESAGVCVWGVCVSAFSTHFPFNRCDHTLPGASSS